MTESANRVAVQLGSGGTALVDGHQVNVSAGTISVGEGSVIFPGQPAQNASDITLTPADSIFQYNGRQYRGNAQIVGTRSYRVINEVMIDDWLKGVLPAEIGKDAPPEALKAQAVTGRSEAIFRLLVPPHAANGYDFCTGVHCQAYKGLGEETPEIRKACDETLGFVLVAEGDIVNAVYHNVCGGITAGAEDVWDSKPLSGLVPVQDKLRPQPVNLSTEASARAHIMASGTDEFCYSGNPNYANYAKKYFRWSKTLDAVTIGRATGVGTVTGIEVTERRPSGRVRKLTVSGTNGTKTFEKELNIRKIFDLWSGLFVLDVDSSAGRIRTVTFTGAGNGHGVGLCQHGAREIARRGGTFDQILCHYYRGATLRRIYRP